MIENSETIDGAEVDFLKEMAAIARMITMARQQANDLGADFPTYCLDLALGAVLQVMEQRIDDGQAAPSSRHQQREDERVHTGQPRLPHTQL